MGNLSLFLTPQPAGGPAPGRHRNRSLPRLLRWPWLLTLLARFSLCSPRAE